MATVSQFEVLLSGVIPISPLPLVAQGYSLQITNAGGSVDVTVGFDETTNFANSSITMDGMTFDLLTANYLDKNGEANPVSTADFIANGNAFPSITFGAGDTLVFGLQAFPVPASSLSRDHPAYSDDPRRFVKPTSIPQLGIQWHGSAFLNLANASEASQLYVYPTTRGVFFDPIVEDTTGQTQDVVSIGLTTGQTYSAVPTTNGTATIDYPANS